MAQPYVGEIRMFAGNFAPAGWMLCAGQTLPISENEVLFQLIGTTYGGDGQETFNLPNLQSRLPMHFGTNGGVTYQIAEMAGVENVTLTVNQIPSHNHLPLCTSDPGNNASPENSIWAAPSPSANIYTAAPPGGNLLATAMQPTGGNQPHENMHPFLCVNFIISLFGIFPSQT